MAENISLETEEAKKAAEAQKAEDAKKAAAEAKPEKAEEKSVTPENESKEKTSDKSAEDAEKAKSEAEKKAAEEGATCTCPDGKPGHVKGGKCMPDEAAKSEEKSTESGADKGKEEAAKAEATKEEKSVKTEKKPSEEAAVKTAAEQEREELLKTVKAVNETMQQVLKANEELTKKVAALEAQPAGRKTTVEIDKTLGDETTTEKDAKSLKKEMDEKIEEIRKTQSANPSQFALIQRVRAEYSKKIAGAA